MLKEAGETGAEQTIEAFAAQAKERFLRTNYHPPKIFYFGSLGFQDLFAETSWQEMRDIGRTAKSEFPVGDLKRVLVVFRGYYGRLGRLDGSLADLEIDEEGFDVIQLKGDYAGHAVGFTPWAEKLKEVLAIAEHDVSTNRTLAIILGIMRTEEGNPHGATEVFRGDINSNILEGFTWGYMGEYPNAR